MLLKHMEETEMQIGSLKNALIFWEKGVAKKCVAMEGLIKRRRTN
jgi:ferritin-like metal-binding protein YciE